MEFHAGGRFGNLEIVRELGRGSYATVYLALDTVIQRHVALKVFRGRPGGLGSEARRIVIEEARLLARVTSPHVVTLYRVHTIEPDDLVIEMEYVDGGSLRDLLDAQGSPELGRSLEILAGIASGLAAAHGAGVVHGDIKPGNILLARDGTAKLADFGLGAALLEDEVSSGLGGGLVGTPRYMAPEVIMGRRPREAADIWSFGVVLYRLLAGRLPFEAADPDALFARILNAPPPPLGLGVPPELARLVDVCLAKEPEQRPPGPDAILRALESVPAGRPSPTTGDAGPEGAPPLPALFGRDELVGALEGRLRRVEEGRGAAVLLGGEGGIGKSAVLRHLAAAAARRGFQVIRTDVDPVAGLLGPLGERLRGGHSGPPLRGSREQIAWGLLQALETAARAAPVALLLEDAHLATPEDLTLLAALPARLRAVPVLLAVTYRLHDDEGSSRGESSRDHRVLSVGKFEFFELKPLARGALLRLIEDAAGMPVAARAAEDMAERAGGNPLFALELLRHLRETHALEVHGGSLVPSRTWEQRHPPRRVRDLVLRRFAGLPTEDRELLDIAAVDGAEFEGDAVAAALEQPLLAVLRRLQELYRVRGLVLPMPAGYSFAHPLIQEVLYDDLAPDLRRTLHGHLARHLEKRASAVDPARIGTHWERAGEVGRARPYLLRAAVAAGERQEIHRTLDFCARAGLSPERIDGETVRDHFDALWSYAACLSDRGDHAAADRVYTAVIERAREAGDEKLALRGSVRRARTLLPSRGIGVVREEEMRHAARAIPDGRERATARYLLGVAHRLKGELDEAVAFLEQAAEGYRAIDHTAGLSDALDQLGTLANAQGRCDEADALYAEAARLSAAVGRRTNAAVSEFNRALLDFERGRLEGVEGRMRQAIAVLESEGIEVGAVHARTNLADVLFAQGDIAAAREILAGARPVLERAGHARALADADELEAGLDVFRGALDEAERRLDSLEEHARETGSAEHAADAAAARVRLLTLQGRIGEAATRARAALGNATTNPGLDEMIERLAEAVVFGLPASTLGTPHADASDRARALERAARALSSPPGDDGAATDLRAAADLLLSGPLGRRRAELRLLGHAFRIAACEREGDADAASRLRAAAHDEARALGNAPYTKLFGGSSGISPTAE